MRLISINNINSDANCKVAKTIFDSTGKPLIKAGAPLSTGILNALIKRNVPYVYIDDGNTDDILPELAVSDATRSAATHKVSTIVEHTVKKKKTSIDIPVKDEVDCIIHDLLANKTGMFNLINIHSMADYLLSHAVNVAIISTAIGIKMGLPKNQLLDLGIGALLHDIGKTCISNELLEKPSQLTAEEFGEVKRHAEFGFELLRKSSFSLTSAHVAFQHHEWWNGTGYPRGIKGPDIHLYGRIVAVADVYDALTSDRPYRPAFLPHDAIELLFGSGNYQFDYEIVKIFKDTVSLYPVGHSVLLSTGDIAAIVKENKISPQRPLVRVIIDSQGKLINNAYEIDLHEQPNILIIKAI